MRNMLPEDVDQIEKRNMEAVVKQHVCNLFPAFTGVVLANKQTTTLGYFK